MLEISWSELLILAVVTLVFVGPKELPIFLRTIGRYAGMLRRQANEFKSQFDAAMREAELASMKEEMEKMQASVNAEVMGAEKALREAEQAGTVTAAEITQPAQPSSFTAVAHAAVFPQASPQAAPAAPVPAPTGQVYVRPQPEAKPAVQEASAAEAEPPRPEVVKSES